MVSSEVQRTLVKSPPELWAELSDPEALARHLGELGEIRITRTKPEERVEWEADGTSGTVVIKPSGWGTKVTLSVTREIVAIEPPSSVLAGESPAEDSPAAEVTPVQEPTSEDQHAQDPVALSTASPEGTGEQEPVTTLIQAEQADPTPAQEPRRGFFARLFGRRKPRLVEDATSPVLETDVTRQSPPEPLAAAETAKADAAEPPVTPDPAIQPQAHTDDEKTPGPSPAPSAEHVQDEDRSTSDELRSEMAADTPSQPAADLSTELQRAEEVAADEVKAVLTAVLDRLGAAHHRPFSRS